ncbi:MAG: phosphate acetyltransferase [Paludibacteraceae bacterium]|nr:phosphate acetyltransferase [Paludibacteraceae bacterium]
MDILQQMYERAKNNKQRIVLPEGDEPRTLEAANEVLKQGLAELILIGDTATIQQMAKEKGYQYIEKATIFDVKTNPKVKEYANLFYELRKSKGITEEQALQTCQDPLYLGCLMVKNGDADGEIAGARGTTADTIRPAFQILKTQPGVKVVSGAFLMFTPAKQLGENGFLVFADCAVNPCPTADELAQIAISTAQTAKNIAGIEPRVAMLSFSTKGSAKHELVDKVTEALQKAKALDPTLTIDGELQLDAALIPSVAETKAKGSNVAGKANVLVFPDLQAGNIGYKLVERFSGADAVGPILQGLAAPVNDLSRGCKVQDIIQMIVITANQAIK